MIRPGARRTAVFLVSVVLAALAVPLVGPAGANETPSACPSQGGTQQHMAESLTVRVAVDGVSVPGLWGNVTPGSTVDVSVVVPPGCPAVELTLASYNSPVAGFSVDQWLADHQTRTIAGSGTRESFQVQVPDCYFQVDFVHGGVITDFRQGMYGPRLIGSDVGGTRTCEQLPAPQPGPSPQPSTPESPSPSPSPESSTPTPSPSPSAPPSPSPESSTPSPTPSPSPESSTPSPSPSSPALPGTSASPSPSAMPTETVTATTSPSPPAAPAPSSSTGVLGVSTTPAVAPAPDATPRVAAAPSPSPQASPTPAATVRVAGDSRVASLADTGIPGSLLAVVALLFGTAGVLLLVSARLRGRGERDRG